MGLELASRFPSIKTQPVFGRRSQKLHTRANLAMVMAHPDDEDAGALTCCVLSTDAGMGFGLIPDYGQSPQHRAQSGAPLSSRNPIVASIVA